MLTPDPFYANNTPFSPQDPLAVGYMSGGQMGYMPQQQYLTPSDYGAFRTLPQTNNSLIPYQRAGVFQNYLYANGGRIGGIPLPTYNPAANSLHRQIGAQRATQDTGVAVGGALFDGALGFGMAAVNPLLGALALVAPSPGDLLANIHGRMRGIQNMTMPKITSGPDVSKSLGMGFSSSSALSLDRFIRSSAAGDAFLKQDDYREIMKKGMEYNMFDYSNSADGYKKVIKRLRNQTDVLLEIVDDKNLDGVFKNLKRLQDMGAEGGVASSVARQEGMFSRMTGMRHSDMVDAYGQQGALLYSQHGLTGYQGSLSAMATAAQITMGQRMGIINPSELARNGGISGFTQKITGESANGMNRTGDLYLPYLSKDGFGGIDEEKLAMLISGKISIIEASKLGAPRVGSAENMSKYESSKPELQKQLMDLLGPIGTQLFQAKAAQDFGASLGIKDKQGQMYAGLRGVFDMDVETAKFQAGMFSNKDYMNSLQDQLARERMQMYAKGAEKTKDERFWAWRTSLTEAVNTPVDWAMEKYQGIQDKWERHKDKELGFFGARPTSSPSSKGHSARVGSGGTGATSSNVPVDDLLGISRKHESRNRGGDTIGWDNNGGTSYGSFQYSSLAGGLEEFISFSEKNYGEAGARIRAEFEKAGPWNTGSEKGLGPETWKRLRAEGVITDEMEAAAARDIYYERPIRALKKRNGAAYDLITGSKALSQAFFSTSVQHGGGGVNSIINEVYRKGMSEEELINAIYDKRSEIMPDLVEKRYKEERADVLGNAASARGNSAAERAAIEAADEFKYTDATRKSIADTDSRYARNVDVLDNMSGLAAVFAGKGRGERSAYGRLYSGSKLTTEKLSAILKDKLGGASQGELSGATADVTRGLKYTAVVDAHKLAILRRLLPTATKEQLEGLLKDKDAMQAIDKAYSMSNSAETDYSAVMHHEVETERLQAYHSILDDKKDELTDDVGDLVGGKDNAKFVMGLHGKNGNSLQLVEMQRLIQSMNSGSLSAEQRAEATKKLYSLANELGLQKKDVATMLSSGSVASSSINGYSKDDLGRIAKIGSDMDWREDGLGAKLDNAMNSAAAIAEEESTRDGRKYLSERGIYDGDYDSEEKINTLLKSDKIDRKTMDFLNDLKAGGTKNIANKEFQSRKISQHLGNIATTKTAEGGKVLDADKGADKALSNAESFLKLDGTMTETAKQLKILNDHLEYKNKPLFGNFWGSDKGGKPE